MAPEGKLIEGAAGDLVRVGLVLPDDRVDLRPDPINRVLIEARLGQRGFQEGDNLIAVFGEHLRGNGHRVIARVEGNIGGQRFPCGGEALRIEITRAFLKRRGHQHRRATLARRIKAGATFEAQLKCGEGQGMLLDQPGADTAGRGNFLNLHGCKRRKGRHDRDGGGKKGADHCISSVVSSVAVSGIIQPVTARRLSSTSAAAVFTSSTVTASSAAGQS